MQTIPILYATFTGNTQEAATSLLHFLEKEFPEISFTLQNVNSYKPGQLDSLPFVFFGSSTWEVDLNPDNMDFFKKLKNENPDLSKTTIALFGLGDKYYEVFCAAQPVVEKTFKELGAKLYERDCLIDGYPTPDVLEPLHTWAKQAVLNFKKTSA